MKGYERKNERDMKNRMPKDKIKLLVAADLRLGISEDRLSKTLKELEDGEHYEACSGVIEAIKESRGNQRGNRET